MSIKLNDNIKVNAGKPLESKYLNTTNSPYTGLTQVLSQVPIAERYRGLTVNINDVEYWFKTGVTNYDLEVKSFDVGQFVSASTFNSYTASTSSIISGIEDDIVYLSGQTSNRLTTSTFTSYTASTQPIINGAITGGTNGLTKSGRNLLLGGNLSNNTTVNFNTNNFTITGTTGTYTLGGNNNSFVGNSGGFIVQLSDFNTFRYASNYSSNYTNRSLVDKEYVDNLIGGFQPKQSVRVATTAPLTGATYSVVGNGQFTSAPTEIDGITLVNGNRVLVKNQVDAKQNGIYVVVSSGVWSRDVDMDGSPSTEVRAGIYTFVETGNTLVGTGWVLIGGNITGSTLTLNVDDINWALFSITPNPYIGGDGIEFSGNTIYVDIAPNSSLDFSGGQLRVNPNIAGNGLSYSSGILDVVANNGLTVNGNAVRLGGTLTGDTEINGSGYTLSILSGDRVEISTTNELILEAPSLVYIDSNVGEILIGYTNNSGVTIGNQGGNRIRVKNEVGDAGQSTSGIKVELFSGSTFEYNNDYSANFTPRSLVDRQYVDNLVTSGVTGFVTELTFNSYTGATENNLNYISGVTDTKLDQSIFNSYTGNSQPILNGAITGVTNLGSGTGLFAQLNGRNVELKSLVAGSNITLTPTSTGITISSLGGGSGSGERIEYTFTQSGHSFSFGDVVEYSGTTFIKALAQSNRDAEIIGFVSDVNGSDFTVVFSGYLQGLSGLSLTNNTTYYLSSTVEGALTSTVPTIEGTLNKPILTTFTNNDGLVFQYRAFVNSTGTTGGGSGTTLQNVGGGNEVFSGASGSFSYLRTLVGSGNTTVSTVGDNIIIFSSGGTGSTNITANNGLTKLGDNIRLGGILTGNTTIDTGNNNLLFDYGKQFNTGTTTVIRSTVGTTEDVNNLVFRNNVSRSVVDGFGDVGLGFNNLNSGSTTSGGNIAIGQNNLNAVTPSGTFSASPWFSTFRGDRNIGIGFNTGKALTGSGSNRATHNILMGSRVLEAATDMSYNIFAGFQTAMNMAIPASSTNGQSNIGFGDYVMQLITGGTASFNVVIGSASARNTRRMDSSNTFIGLAVGRDALYVGDDNTGIGDSAFREAAWTTINNNFNTAVGASAFRNIVEGSERSTAIGTSSGRYGGGIDNTYIGRAAGWTVRGTGNVSIGFQSGHVSNNNYSGAAGTPYIGTGSTFIGYRSGYPIASSGVSSVIVIGSNYQPTLVAGNTYLNANNELHFAITGNTKLTINNAGVIEYSSDVSGDYTNRSLVDKEYVDNQITTSQNLYTLKRIVTGDTTLDNNDFVIFCSGITAMTITLPASPVDGQVYKIKDVSGNALNDNITIDGNGNTIDGGSNMLINTNRGAVELCYDSTLDSWQVMSFVN